MINHKSSRQLDLKALYTRIGSMTTKNTSSIITHKRSIFSSHFYLPQRLETRKRHSPFIGDHDRPSHRLTRIEDDYYKGLTHVNQRFKTHKIWVTNSFLFETYCVSASSDFGKKNMVKQSN